ncbi:MAG: hypothetical protein N4J56_002884 [Chroococcidiopsis sp. SAG 2025]|uniref:hypothetical protein n=1 Tax=Chroococcidiopsis sp. SAG 2025 TaxID=171389 RepID=UPI002936FCEE|nr:hypothetical protein [Chroococcidiopsis sp. SAG 2025]MDV2993230.1 hypothetical protein [Chroococcidiopsis sp. SAG 2025]
MNTSTISQGDAGNINITIADTLSLTNGSAITANSFLGAEGDAGSINVAVRSLNLDNGSIFAQSISGNGGDIKLEAGQRVGLRNGSQITTSVGTEQKPGNGGDITINSPLVIANFNGNNDIITNAFPGGSGGNIRFEAQNVIGFLPLISRQTVLSLFGTNPTAEEVKNFLNSSPSNDVASLSGSQVDFNSGEVVSVSDLAELPTTPVDASTLVASGCPSGAENRFVVAGRGGLPPAPGDKLSTDALLTDWATLETPETENRAAVETTTPETANTTATSLVEATTWQFGSKGEIILSNADRNTPNQLNATPSNCHSS